MKRHVHAYISAICALVLAVSLLLSRGTQAEAQEQRQFDRAVLDTGTQNSGAILQDRDGFLWIGTYGAGLFRYDGYELQAYKPGGPNSLSSPYVHVLYEDRDGIIWIGTGGGGLDRYDKETNSFTHYRHDPQNPQSISDNTIAPFRLQAIREDTEGKLWIGTQNGLNVLDKSTGTFKHYFHDPNNLNSLSHNYIGALLFDSQGILWIGTEGGGLNRFDPKNETFTRYVPNPATSRGLGGVRITSLVQGGEGTLWIATLDNGLFKFDQATETFAHYLHDPRNPNSLMGNKIASMYQDDSGAIWIVYSNTDQLGLSVFDPQTNIFTHYTHDPANTSSLSSTSINNVYQDRAGIVWIVNNTGLVDKLDRHKPKFVLYRHDPGNPNSLNSNVVVPMLQDRQGRIWIGTDVGLQMYDKQTNTFIEYVKGYYSGLYEDDAGIFWLGGGGEFPTSLHILDRSARKIARSFTHDPQDPKGLVNSRQIFAIIGDNQDSDILWIATADAGLEKFQKSTETFTHYQHDPQDSNSLSNNNLLTLYQDRQGVLWIPTNGGGLNRFDPRSETFTHLRHDPQNPNSLSADTVNVVFEDAAGMLWVGTAAGFDRFDRQSQTFRCYTSDTGYPVSMIALINQDADGNLWMGSLGGDGLIRFDPHTETMRVYKESDGLQGNVFYPLNGIQDRDGMMWFGGPNGLTAFYPREIQDNPYIPPVMITALKQGGEPFQLTKAPERVRAIVLDWQHNFFEFEYTALSFTSADKNQYKYMLEGWDKDWFYAGTRRFGRYSGLPNGHYTLRIVGSNNDGVWNEEGISLQVTVVPPFWRTWWFRGGLGVLALGLVAGGLAWRAWSSEAQRRRLEKLVNERTRALAESNAQLKLAKDQAEAANRELEAFAYSVSHDLRAPLRAMDGFSQALQEDCADQIGEVGQGYIGRIRAAAQRMSELIDGLLQLSRITRGELTVTPIDLSDLAGQIADELQRADPDRQVEWIIAPGLSAFGDRRMLHAALENLLGNAWKFTSRCERAQIEFGAAQVEGQLAFFVRDNGAGFDMAYADKLFGAFQRLHTPGEFPGTGIGLATVQRIIHRHGGRIWAQGQVDGGATFWFTLALKEKT